MVRQGHLEASKCGRDHASPKLLPSSRKAVKSRHFRKVRYIYTPLRQKDSAPKACRTADAMV